MRWLNEENVNFQEKFDAKHIKLDTLEQLMHQEIEEISWVKVTASKLIIDTYESEYVADQRKFHEHLIDL